MAAPFWETTPLDRLSPEQWESLCDGCARCCVHKLEDMETGERYYTNVACRLLNRQTCRCDDYADRRRRVPECESVHPPRMEQLCWMPETCAYRLLAEGKSLPPWHPLVSGDRHSTGNAGMSVRDRVIPEAEAGDMEDHIVSKII